MLKMYCVCLSFLFLITDVVRCAPSYSFDSEARGWLKLHTTPETWEDAYLTCHNEGAVLASPLDQKLAYALHTLMRQSDVPGKIFLGTHALFSKEHFVSIEGVPLYDMGVPLPSQDVSTGDCLSMTVNARTYYSSCNHPLPFICYRKSENQTMNECGTFDNAYQFNNRTGSCYKLHSEKLAWHIAFSKCASEGGHLVILNDAEEASIIKDMFPDHSGEVDKWEQFHIGVVAWGRNRIWTTIHGQRIEDVFNGWDANQPDNFYGDQIRATFRRRTGKMDDVQEHTVAMFVCELSPRMGNEELMY